MNWVECQNRRGGAAPSSASMAYAPLETRVLRSYLAPCLAFPDMLLKARSASCVFLAVFGAGPEVKTTVRASKPVAVFVARFGEEKKGLYFELETRWEDGRN